MADLMTTGLTGLAGFLAGKNPIIEHIVDVYRIKTGYYEELARVQARAEHIKSQTQKSLEASAVAQQTLPVISLHEGGDSQYTKVLEGSSLSPIAVMALEQDLLLNKERIIRSFEIFAKADPHLDQSASPENLSKDFLLNFKAKSEDVADNETQELWAKILAGEANKKGSFAKKTMDIISNLEKSDAELFNTFCQFLITFDEGIFLPYFPNQTDPIYEEVGINEISLLHLEYLGLVKVHNLSEYYQGFNGKHFVMNYFDRRFLIQKDDQKFISGKVSLTESGIQLARIATRVKNPNFEPHFLSTLQRQGAICIQIY